ncbi:galanin receptor 2b-like [Saccoglossus kowalevskii]|uniref:Allatostatin-A receptor-like n=1 Tax=Saccoglossus kowalevskii TaxID=10224 RepID=A0ABM0MMJ7_SACKO|nr:PREDICTED: allatostatin-A receptor-like [Saccoglossus kowalevskii]
MENNTTSPLYITEVDNDSTTTETLLAINLYNDPVSMKICFGFIGVIGMLGNLLVVVVFLRKAYASSNGLGSTNIFMLNQSLLDLVSSILLIANLIVVRYVPDGLKGDIFCKLWVSSKYPMWACFLGSTFNLVLLTLERYCAIVHPIIHHTRFTPKKAKVMVCIVWPFCFIYELHWAMVHVNDNRGGCLPIRWKYLYIVGTVILIFQYLIPLFIMVFSYVAILRVVRRQSRVKPNDGVNLNMEGVASSGSNPQPKPLSRTEKNVIMTLLIVVVMYIICWSPNQIYYFFFNLGVNVGVDVEINGVFFQYTVVSVCCNMCVNPFIYAAKLKDFRDDAAKLLRCGSSKKPAFVSVA